MQSAVDVQMFPAFSFVLGGNTPKIWEISKDEMSDPEGDATDDEEYGAANFAKLSLHPHAVLP
jgi:hypothetical protein